MEKVNSSSTLLRIQAINLVSDYRPVLSDDQFVNAMRIAVKLYKEGDAVSTLKQTLFGDDHETIEELHESMHLIDEMNRATSVTCAYKKAIVHAYRTGAIDLKDLEHEVDKAFEVELAKAV